MSTSSRHEIHSLDLLATARMTSLESSEGLRIWRQASFSVVAHKPRSGLSSDQALGESKSACVDVLINSDGKRLESSPLNVLWHLIHRHSCFKVKPSYAVQSTSFPITSELGDDFPSLFCSHSATQEARATCPQSFCRRATCPYHMLPQNKVRNIRLPRRHAPRRRANQ